MVNPLYHERPNAPSYSSSNVPDEHLGAADIPMMDIPLYGPSAAAAARAPAVSATSGGPAGSVEDEDFVGVVELPVRK
jgi:hypothetical protein